MIKYREEIAVAREQKDRLFKIIFGRHENREWTLSLYNAINGSNYDDPDAIEITTIENAVYMGMRNDVSFLIFDTMNFYEHQSTYNPNMPIRMLIFVGSVYSKYVQDGRNNVNIYSTTQQKLPLPKLVCFYNGLADREDRAVLKLSDAFDSDKDSDIEVNVTMLNINYGHNEQLMESCRALKDYSKYVEEWRVAYKKTANEKEATEEAINALSEDSPIKPFLIANKAEVTMSIITEYDEARTMELFKEEYLAAGRAEGLEAGRAEGLEAGRAEGRKEARADVVRALKEKLNMPDEEILTLGLELDEDISVVQEALAAYHAGETTR